MLHQGTGYAGKRLGEADHPGPGTPAQAQGVQKKLWEAAKGWSIESVMANGGVNSRVLFLRNAFLRDSAAANKHMQGVMWWNEWVDIMMFKILDFGISATEVHVPNLHDVHFFIIRMLKNILISHKNMPRYCCVLFL